MLDTNPKPSVYGEINKKNKWELKEKGTKKTFILKLTEYEPHKIQE